MYKSEFHISKMDCPSEEQMIRMKLSGISGIKKLEFDIENRKLTVIHSDDNPDIEKRLNELNLGSKFIGTYEIKFDEK